MALSDCSKCWETPCVCGHDYQERSAGYLRQQILMLQRVLMENPCNMEDAPKDRPILAWCDHEADEFVKPGTDGRSLTLYAAHYEGLSHAGTGWRVIEWGGGFTDTGEMGEIHAELPDWWFVVETEHEVAANPVFWMDLPAGKK